MTTKAGSATFLLRLAIAVALPSVACVGWYSLDDLRPEYSAWAVAVVLAYPLLLIGVAGGVMQWVTPQRRSKWLLGLSAACVVLPTLLLWVVHA
jgi:hypothetical protein